MADRYIADKEQMTTYINFSFLQLHLWTVNFLRENNETIRIYVLIIFKYLIHGNEAYNSVVMVPDIL